MKELLESNMAGALTVEVQDHLEDALGASLGS